MVGDRIEEKDGRRKCEELLQGKGGVL